MAPTGHSSWCCQGQGQPSKLSACPPPPKGKRASMSFTTGIAFPDHFVIKEIFLLFCVSLFWWEFLHICIPEKYWSGMRPCVALSCRVGLREPVRPWHRSAESQVAVSVFWCVVRVGRPLSNLRSLSLLSSPSGCLSMQRTVTSSIETTRQCSGVHPHSSPQLIRADLLALGSWCSCVEVESSGLGVRKTGFESHLCLLY